MSLGQQKASRNATTVLKVNGNKDVKTTGSSKLRVLVDASVIESFVDNGVSARWIHATPSLATSVGVAVVSEGGAGATCSFISVAVYPMSPFVYDISLCEDEGCL
uniref:Glycosyl hydrolase family 32 C-terminal domain-containing protein n=1 Tax=Octactis speculum TaxID=3111310 RepID=A0A7S2HHW5_9STRA|eukprot:CAMPEP_0185755072 /NCGR_PEP_ID=MMETSP1174-20130828/13615_1 /TAXON_ID=35687 /ORGANISM="Dictyocha speculum, Strain CCMP1381" /LENGTH=104 /DNA_ID=CAMNT_0028433495 /DNA_START=25 /DNA_END=339 /DNA_ORIENTATION=-